MRGREEGECECASTPAVPDELLVRRDDDHGRVRAELGDIGGAAARRRDADDGLGVAVDGRLHGSAAQGLGAHHRLGRVVADEVVALAHIDHLLGVDAYGCHCRYLFHGEVYSCSYSPTKEFTSL